MTTQTADIYRGVIAIAFLAANRDSFDAADVRRSLDLAGIPNPASRGLVFRAARSLLEPIAGGRLYHSLLTQTTAVRRGASAYSGESDGQRSHTTSATRPSSLPRTPGQDHLASPTLAHPNT